MKNNRFAFCLVMASIALLFSLPAVSCAGTSGQNKHENAGAGSASFTGPPGEEFYDGMYEGSAEGHRGNIHVRVCLEAGNITGIEILDSREDPFVGGPAIEELLEQTLTSGITDIDSISGATESSEGFLAAVRNALSKSRRQ